jgi:acyl-CoA dehydrogenase
LENYSFRYPESRAALAPAAQIAASLDEFIEPTTIKPLQAQDDNERFFDHRREWARTDWDNDGLPRHEWEELLRQGQASCADNAGHLRFAWPKEMGGKDGSQLWMAVIREHLAAKGLGLFNDLQNEHSIVGNNPAVLMFKDFATPEQVPATAALLKASSSRASA